MTAYLDNLYFEWLYGQIGSVRQKNPARTYWGLCRILFAKEFVWFVPNDDNRIEDGKDLRIEFLKSENLDPDRSQYQEWIESCCSMLELLIGLARRLAFETNADPQEWFWEMVENLDLREYNDSVRLPEGTINRILDRVIWRTYRRDGSGGLFPLQRTRHDQRDVELWYQMSAYLL